MPSQVYAASEQCPVWESLGVDAASEIFWQTNAEKGRSTSGLDETATKRSFARQTQLGARLLAVRLAR